jgi:hypothetical protein
MSWVRPAGKQLAANSLESTAARPMARPSDTPATDKESSKCVGETVLPPPLLWMLRTVVVTGWVVVVTFVWWIHVVSLESIRSHILGRLHIRLLLFSSSSCSSCGCYIAYLYRLPRHWVSPSHLPLPVIHVADPIFSFSHTLSSSPGLLLPLSLQTTQQHKVLLLLPLSMQTTQQHKLVKNSLLWNR